MRILRSKLFWLGIVLAVAFLIQSGMALFDAVEQDQAAHASRLAAQGDKPIYRLRPGDCFFLPEDARQVNVFSQPCRWPHDAEVFARFEMVGEDYPGEDEVRNEARFGCAAEFEQFTGLRYDLRATLRVYGFRPTETSWTARDDRWVTCSVVDPSGRTAGTLGSRGGRTPGDRA